MTYTDKLTGVYNRRFFEESLEKMQKSSYYPLGIIVADINSLKVFNDAFGHQLGDQLLQAVAKILNDTVSKDSILSRVGGDEFTILVPNTDDKALADLVQTFNEAFNKVYHLPIKPSVSFGYACHDDHTNMKAVKSIAENAMYECKLISSIYVKKTIVSSLKEKLKKYTSENIISVNRLKLLTQHMGEALSFSFEEKKKLNLLAEVHNIGEIGISKSLFRKEVLTLKEYDIIKSHVKRGYRIVNASQELNRVSEEMLSHHERWDGSGYPRGLETDEIPLVARAFSVLDAYNAMLSHKPYRDAMAQEEAISELKRGKGSQFDPTMVDVFVKKVLEIEK
jgi:diguanylate cyclase (GGDEF)-like protein